ncbi:MAG: protein-(glutamine-N5) methyltransferase, release factor-specific, partial [Parascardovia denticolens]
SSPQTLAQLDDQADLVLTNPPYVPLTQIPQQPEVRDYDPAAALYGGSDDGLAIPEKIVRRAAAFLRPGGLLVMEHDSSQSHALVSFATSVGFSQAHTAPDLTGRDRFLVADKAEG